MDKWNKLVEVESNHYNWDGIPKILEAKKSNSEVKFVHIDLFSGCGGFSTGFEEAGFTTELAIDIHPPSLNTLYINHQNVTTILGDIRKVSANKIKEFLKTKKVPTVITAGVPCQGFSLANRKRHAEDKRNFLFKEFIRITKEVKPTAVVLENVSGLVSTKNGKFKKDILNAISELGYEVYFSLLNAADYGVPQIRRRIFFIGIPKGSFWLFPNKIHGTNKKPYNTVKDAILGDLPELKADQFSEKYLRPPVSELQKYLRKDISVLKNHKSPNHPQETIEMIKNTKPGQPMYKQFKQRIRLHPNYPSPTQICGGIRPQFQFGHPTQNRGLTIRERARIQSFPDSYEFFGGVVQGRVQTGNAVPPLLAKVIAEQLIKIFSGKKIFGEKGEEYQKDFFD
jgi:DNA (cytosine-5)-methyltransferase 1